MQTDKLDYYRRLTVFIPIVAGIVLIILALLYFRYEKRHTATQRYLELRSIGELKSTQISAWYEQCKRDAKYLSSDKHLNDFVNTYLTAGKPDRAGILKYLTPVIREDNYEEVMIFGTDGSRMFSYDEGYTVDSVTLLTVQKVFRTNNIVVRDLYYCPFHHKIHHDVLAPVHDKDRITAVLLLRTDPASFLYPYIQKWPVPSRTSETILVGRNSGYVLFLNEMKKVPNAALKYRIPLTDTTVPAVMAALGKKGMFRGKDYVGDKVLSDLRRIQGTPWSLVVKVDTRELYEELYYKTFLIGILVLMTILLISGALVFGYKKRQTINQRIKEEAVHQLFAEELKNQVAERTSQLEQLNQDLLSFTNIFSHDLKEPVRKIKTFLTLIRENQNDTGQSLTERYFNRIEISINRLENIIAGVLDYSFLDSGLKVEKVDLNETISSIRNDLELIIASKNAELFIGSLPVLEGSPRMLYQLFYHLINNSLKFTEAGKPVKIEIAWQGISKDGKEYAEIVVKDNGIGFDPVYSFKIFESFKRLHPQDTYEGAGLGLALCKRIVQTHKGWIFATSNPGEGAVFKIVLPLEAGMPNVQ